MKPPVEINGIMFTSLKQAAANFGYSSDHLARLSKARKIQATQVGRSWFVNEKSLESYFADQQTEAEVRQHMLSKQRQMDLRLRSSLIDSNNRHVSLSAKSSKLAVMFACLFFGLLVGVTSQIVPVDSVSLASLSNPAQVELEIIEQSKAAQPVFTVAGNVFVGGAGRWVEKPEVTPQWVQITP
jgi:hypothetical protein